MQLSLPNPSSDEAHDALLPDHVLWRTATHALATHLNLSGPVARYPTGSCPVLRVGNFVVKWIHDLYVDEAIAEGVCLRHAAQLSELAAPRLAHQGRSGSWTWLVLTRIPGRSWHELDDTMDGATRVRVARQVGESLRALHGLPAPACPRNVDWPAFVHARIQQAPADQHKRGLDPTLVDQISPFIQATGIAKIADAKTCLLHADLHHQHVLVQDGQMSGWIDFADGFVGGHAYELLTPGIFLAQGDAAIIDALLDGYGDAELAARESDWWLALTLLHRFAHLRNYMGKLGMTEATALSQVARQLWPR